MRDWTSCRLSLAGRDHTSSQSELWHVRDRRRIDPSTKCIRVAAILITRKYRNNAVSEKT